MKRLFAVLGLFALVLVGVSLVTRQGEPTPVLPTLAAPPTLTPMPVSTELPPAAPVPNQAILRFAPNTSAAEQAAYITSIGATVTERIDALDTLIVQLPNAQTLPASPLLAAAEPDYYLTAQLDDPFYPVQWALPAIGAPRAWLALGANPRRVIVALLDSGICADHLDLQGVIVPGWDFVENDAIPQDDYGHGCAVAGVVAANSDNSLGMVGVAPNADIMPLRVLDGQGVGTYSRVAAAIVYAVDHGAHILNLSLGGVHPSTTLQAAVDYAVANDVLVIAAAGNTGSTTVLYPAAYEPVIAVGAVNRDLQTSPFSSTRADLYAPGEGIFTTSRTGFNTLNGTSLAAPHVAGVAALEMALGRALVVDGGLVTVGAVAVEPTLVAETGDTILTCNPALVTEAENAFYAALEQGGNVPTARSAYLDAAAGCFALHYNQDLTIDPGGYHAGGDAQAQFLAFGTKWMDNTAATRESERGESYPVNQPPGTPGGTIYYSFMAENIQGGIPLNDAEEGLGSSTARIVSIASLKPNNSTCDFKAQIVSAFDLWEATFANLEFVETPGGDNNQPFNHPDATLGIRIGAHVSDGIGKHLAHAYFPPPVEDELDATGTGDIHFDAAENWGCTPLNTGELDLRLIAAHEIGHAIGLDHETIRAAVAVMNPSYNVSLATVGLQPDDSNGVKALYGVTGSGTPGLNEPRVGAIVAVSRPLFDWSDVDEAARYQFQVATDFASPLVDDTVTASTTRLLTPLVNGDYQWRVRANNGDGWGAWSDTGTFTIRIGVPALIAPVADEPVEDPEVTFRWTTVIDDSQTFHLQVATDPNFELGLIVDDNDIEDNRPYQVTLPEDASEFYWRVSAGGDWSASRRFTLVSNAPTLTSPALGALLTDGSVLLDWEDVSGASEYQLQTDTSPNFVGLLFVDEIFLNRIFLNRIFLNRIFLNRLESDPIFLNRLFGDNIFLNRLFNDEIFLNRIFLNRIFLNRIFLSKITTSQTTLPQPFSQGTHYWRVRALLPDGTWSAWSEARHFIVDDPDRSDVVINEIEMREPSWIELYNGGTTSADLAGWQFVTYQPNGEIGFAYTIPAGVTLEAGAYLVLHERAGTHTERELFMGGNTINWVVEELGAQTAALDLLPAEILPPLDTVTNGAALELAPTAPTLTPVPAEPVAQSVTTAEVVAQAPGDMMVDTLSNVIADNGSCSLAEAIIAANTGIPSGLQNGECSPIPGNAPDTLILPFGSSVPIRFAFNNVDGPNAFPSITSALTIDGKGGTIQRFPSPTTANFRFFHVAVGGNLTLKNLTLRNGRTFEDPAPGGSIYNAGSLFLDGVTVINSLARGNGGGIYSTGQITVTNSYFGSNSAVFADESYSGGGIYSNGTALVQSTQFFSNQVTAFGGALFAQGSTVVLSSTFQNNVSNSASGGAVVVPAGSTLTLEKSEFSGNSASGAGGAIVNGGTLTITDSSLHFNRASSLSGGAIYHEAGSLTLTNTTLVSNQAANDGGGLAAVGTGSVNLNFVTFSDNQATSEGNAIFNTGVVVQLKNSIVGPHPLAGTDCVGAINPLGVSFDTDGSCGSASQVTSAALNLGTLASNGGVTRTVALGGGSVAFNAATDCTLIDGTTALATDQRGVQRGSPCDVGAYELGDSPQIGTLLRVTTTSLVNDGTCSIEHCTLVDAIIAANAAPDATTLDLIDDGVNMYDLQVINNSTALYGSNALPVITTPVTIRGNGLTIQRSTVLGTPEFRLFQVDPGGSLTLNDVNVMNGRVSSVPNTLNGAGSAILNRGQLTINRGDYQNNRADSGGVIGNAGTLTVLGGSFSNNTADVRGGVLWNDSGAAASFENSRFELNSAIGEGGAFYNRISGTLTVSNDIFVDNTAGSGGAIYNGGTLTLTGGASTTSFDRNTATGNGGAIFNTGTLLGDGTDIFDGSADSGGALFNSGTATFSNVNLSNNRSTAPIVSGSGGGGAIYNAPGGSLTLTGAFDISLNQAANNGGGIYHDGVSLILNADAENPGSIGYNTANQNGGGIYANSNPITLDGVDISENTATLGVGGGISTGGPLDARNTQITANNSQNGGGGLHSSVITLTDSSLTNNETNGIGGALYSLGPVTLVRTDVVNSFAGGNGGGLHVNGTLSITGGYIINNESTGAAGGGIYLASGGLDMRDATLTSNTAFSGGGALHLSGGVSRIENSLIQQSEAGTDGGAILTVPTTNLTINSSRLSNNSALVNGGAIYNTGTLTINNTEISTNSAVGFGGGLNNAAALGLSVVLNNVVISGNSTPGDGGGIANIGNLTLENSTLVGNSASQEFGQGGGVYNNGQLLVRNTTLTDNSADVGGAINNASFSNVLTIQNSTIVDNLAAESLRANTGTVTITNSILSNILGANCTVMSGTLTVTSSLEFGGPLSCGTGTLLLDPMLGTFNGRFFPLLVGSPAIDTASVACPPNDQRGFARGFNSVGLVNIPAAGDCDIGAIEVAQVTDVPQPPQIGTTGGAAALVSGINGLDFVRFGNTNVSAPLGTAWMGDKMEDLPEAGRTFGRDPVGSDTDDRTDWSRQYSTLGGQNGITVVINEVTTSANDAVELHNTSLETVRLDGWRLATFNALGNPEVDFIFPAGTIIEPRGFLVLREGNSGTDPNSLYLNDAITWADWNARGAVTLTNGVGGMDYMRFGDTNTVIAQGENSLEAVQPQALADVRIPFGTFWHGSSPNSPLPNQALGRDSIGTDTDEGKDFFAQAPSLGRANPASRPAPNDLFENALTISNLPFRNTQDTTRTLRTTEAAFVCGFDAGHTVWYEWTARASMPLVVQTDGSDFDTVLAVYTNSLTGPNPIAGLCSDDTPPRKVSRLAFDAVAGTTYYFQVGGANFANGNLVFSVQPPPNDDFDDAIVIGSVPFVDEQVTTAASLALDDPTPTCGLSIGRTIWYRFTPGEPTDLILRSTDSTIDAVISVWTGDRGSLLPIACNDAGLAVSTSLEVRMLANQTYYIMVGGSEGIGGAVELAVEPIIRPINDSLTAPLLIRDPLPYHTAIDTIAATSDADEPALTTCAGKPIRSDKTVWFTYTPDASRTVTLQAGGFDTVLAVWSDTTQSPIACNDDAGGLTAALSLNLSGGVTYTILAGGYNDDGGLLVFDLFAPAPPPANDVRSGAIPVSQPTFTHTQTTTGANDNAGDIPLSCSPAVGKTVWFRYDAAENRELRLLTSGSDFVPAIGVFADVNGTLLEIACANTSAPLITNTGDNTALYILIGDSIDIGGALTLQVETIEPRPANDVFDTPTVISALPFAATQSTLRATTAPDDPLATCGTPPVKTVWYAFTPITSGDVLRLQTTGTDFDANLSVWTGSRGSLREIACSPASPLEFALDAGTSYFILIGANDSIGGTLHLQAEHITLTSSIIADAGDDQTLPDTDGDGSIDLMLDGSGSSGDSLTYAWYLNGLLIADGVNPAVTLAAGTNYPVTLPITLVVTDAFGTQRIDIVQIIVTAPDVTTTQTLTLSIDRGSDDVNEEGTSFSPGSNFIWVGTGAVPEQSLAGLRFNGVSIPPDAEIISATLEFYMPDNSWISVHTAIRAEASDDSATFSAAARPTSRSLGAAEIIYNRDISWEGGNWYDLGDVTPLIREVIARPGWQSGNSLALIVRGLGTQWGRKFVNSFERDPLHAPRLVITFRTGETVNLAPDARPDTARTWVNRPLTLEVRANDSDPEGGVLRLNTLTPPANGSALITPGGVLYTPNTDFSGDDSFTYQVCDPLGACSQADVTITVDAAPIITTDVQVNQSSDDVNSESTYYHPDGQNVWLGTSWDVAESRTGLRFNDVNIPPGARIIGAHIEVYTQSGSWITVNLTIAGEASPNSLTFSPDNPPALRPLTVNQAVDSSDVPWAAGTWNRMVDITPIIQEIIDQPGWEAQNSLSLILRGFGREWGRKFVTSFDGSPDFAPRLVITWAVPSTLDPLTFIEPLTAQTAPTPAALLTADVVAGSAPLTVQFGGVGAWDFGDGSTTTATNPAHTYLDGGHYVVTLTGVDGNSAQIDIQVAAAPITVEPPTASPTETPTSVSPPATSTAVPTAAPTIEPPTPVSTAVPPLETTPEVTAEPGA